MDSVVSLENVSIFASSTLATPILSEVSFRLAPGELVYLVGKVGSGKSSLMRTLYAEIPLKTGNAEVCGYDLSRLNNYNFHNFRRSIGIVFQEYNLLDDMTIYNNLEFVLRATDWKLRSAIKKRIEEVLQMVEMTDKAFKKPRQISGGERQRICIARALLNSPKLIIADEPTGNLDPVAASDVISLFHSVAKSTNCSVLISTHNSENIRLNPSRSLRCADGFIEQI